MDDGGTQMGMGGKEKEEGRHHFDNDNNKSVRDGDGGASSSTNTRTRIFVGGLGRSVTEDDLRKTFSSLGEVESVDIVRTKGRSFAYLDFLPSSINSLPKLFSTYNGCMWKGGKLKLEKAKEHYLLRLRREWAEVEDSKLGDAHNYNADAAEKMHASEKPKNLSILEKMQLQIFFPKLKKMKSVPFSGTGKHKYSFQRVDVPSLPHHFCDCEEHADSSHMTKEKPFCNLESESGGINKQELDMMKSVMNKLLEREKCPQASCSKAGLAQKGDNSFDSIDALLVRENDSDCVTDEDYLITNMVAGGNDNLGLLARWGQETITTNQEPMFNELQTSKDKPAWKMSQSQRKQILPYNKKRKSPLPEESDGNEILSSIPERKRSVEIHLNEPKDQTTGPESGTQQSMSNFSWSQKFAWRDLVGERDDTPFHISHIKPSIPSTKKEQPRSDGLNVPNSTAIKNQNLVKHENSESQSGQSKELKELAEALPAKLDAVLDKSSRGASWLQKSSWTQLVGDTNNSSFRISQILPGLTPGKQGLLHPNDIDAANSTGTEQCNLFKSGRSESTGDCSKDLGLANKDLITAPFASIVIPLPKKEQNPAGPDVQQTTPENKLQTDTENNGVSAPTLGNKHPSAPKQTSVVDFGIGETCLFMRSAASMKEWTKTKTALSGSLRKKGDEK